MRQRMKRENFGYENENNWRSLIIKLAKENEKKNNWQAPRDTRKKGKNQIHGKCIN
jgi:hypothetical protein